MAVLFLFRYGHGSCLLSDGSIIVVGGYGESSRVGSAPHSRLNDTLKLHLDKNEWELCDLDTQGIYPGVNLIIISDDIKKTVFWNVYILAFVRYL